MAARGRRGRRRRPRHGARPVRQRVRPDRVPGGAVHAAVRDPADPAVRAVRPAVDAARRAPCGQQRAAAVLRHRRHADAWSSSTATGDVWRDLGHRRRRSRWPPSASARRPCGVVRREPRGRPDGPRSSLVRMPLLRQPLLLLARSERVKNLVSTMPVSAGIVRSYVPGEDTADAVRRDGRPGRRRTSGSPSTTSARTPSTPTRPTRPCRPTSTCSALSPRAG